MMPLKIGGIIKLPPLTFWCDSMKIPSFIATLVDFLVTLGCDLFWAFFGQFSGDSISDVLFGQRSIHGVQFGKPNIFSRVVFGLVQMVAVLLDALSYVLLCVNVHASLWVLGVAHALDNWVSNRRFEEMEDLDEDALTRFNDPEDGSG